MYRYHTSNNRNDELMMAKRQRISTPSWWDEIVGEVTKSGGVIHRGVTFLPESRSIVCNVEIEEKTLVFRILKKSILSAPSGSSQYAWIQELNDKVQNPVADIMLAYRLAAEDPTYLKTLPPKSSWNSLPRRWPEDTLQNCLSGSPLMERVKKQKVGLQADYRSLSEANESAGPSLEDFDDMLAAVTSRAFAGQEDEIMMIPILDLCNHSRGKNEEKNLEYKILDDGSVEVRAVVKIKPNENFRLTYGAKSNQQLLLNYGFAMKDNVEPDGSSNDFLEFCCNGTTVELKTGPKDYTYGKFIKIMEHAFKNSAHGFEEEEEDVNDIDSFLDGGDDMGEVDIYGEALAEELPGNGEQFDEKERELEALKRLKQVIRERMAAYSYRGSKLRERLERQDNSIEYFSSLLLLSEQRCLFFYFCSAQKVEVLLQNKDLRMVKKAGDFTDLPIDDDDLLTIDRQTTDLAKVYMMIRHGDDAF